MLNSVFHFFALFFTQWSAFNCTCIELLFDCSGFGNAADLILNISNWAPENKNVANGSWKIFIIFMTCQMDNFPVAMGHVLMLEKHCLDDFKNGTFFHYILMNNISHIACSCLYCEILSSLNTDLASVARSGIWRKCDHVEVCTCKWTKLRLFIKFKNFWMLPAFLALIFVLLNVCFALHTL